ncbi:MKNK2 isoform 1, partial [Pongo abelii]
MVQKKPAELQGFHRSFKGQNPFELAFPLDQPDHGDSDFGLQCSARPGEGPEGEEGTGQPLSPPWQWPTPAGGWGHA